MAFIRVNSTNGHLFNPGNPNLCFEDRLRKTLQKTPSTTPIILFVHGYRYSPLIKETDPQSSLYAQGAGRACWKVKSWPHHLGLFDSDRPYAIGLAYGWDAAPRYKLPIFNLRDIYMRAYEEAQHLATVLHLIKQINPTRKIDFFAHSMGARVVLQAIHMAPDSNLGRVILLGGTEYSDTAYEVLKTPAAQSAEFYNITARQNILYDVLFAYLGPWVGNGEKLLGAGLQSAPSNWIDIRLDCPQTMERLQHIGVNLAKPDLGFCHWTFYIRDGVFDLYRYIFERQPNTKAFELNKLIGIEQTHTPVWDTLTTTASALQWGVPEGGRRARS